MPVDGSPPDDRDRSGSVQPLPLRLSPGDDLRRALQSAVAERGCEAAYVVGGIGSLGTTCLRFAGRQEIDRRDEPMEILTLAGTLAPDGSHLHMSVADAGGRVLGGHVAFGCIVRTTAEVLVVLMPQWAFRRERDAATGYAELVVSAKR